MTKKDIVFCFNRPLEFHYSLSITSMSDKLIKSLEEEKGIKPDKEIIDIIEGLKSKLSKYITGEMHYFYHEYVNICCGIGQLIFMGCFNQNYGAETVEEMIDIIEKSDEETLFSYMVEYVYFENKNKSIREIYDWDKIKNDTGEMLKIIKEIQFYDSEMKQKVVECLENPKETKQRYCLLLRQFYEKAYREIEQDIFNKIIPYIEQYKKMFDHNPEEFSKNYFNKDINVFGKNLNVHISYFRYVDSDYWSNMGDSEWISFGYQTIKYYRKEAKEEKVLQFLKAISDKRRMKMIELLSQKPWYVNEIADKIGMSAATASYHLTTLQELDIVNFERYDHRFYYSLNKDKLKELFNEAQSILIQ